MTIRQTGRCGSDSGMVTAEIAVAIPALMLLLAAALTAIMVIGGQLRCVDAAREAARALARDEPPTVAHSLARQVAPGASLSSSTAGDRVTAEVRARIRPLGGVLPTFTVHAEAVALHEPENGAAQ